MHKAMEGIMQNYIVQFAINGTAHSLHVSACSASSARMKVEAMHLGCDVTRILPHGLPNARR